MSISSAGWAGGRYYWKSHFVIDPGDDLIALLVEAGARIPGEFSRIFIEGMGGAVARVDPQATAFANRRALQSGHRHGLERSG